MAAAQREVVDPEHGHLIGLGVWQRSDQAQQGAAADRQPKPVGQPRAGAVRAGQAGWWQKNRRIRSRITTGRPPMAASARVRS